MKRGGIIASGLAVAAIGLTAGIYTGQRYTPARPQNPPSLSAESIDRLFASTLSDASGNARPFSRWRGKTLVVNFWATWCPPCREEMPAFSRLQRKYAANGVQFVGIALDTEENVRDFTNNLPVSYPLVMGGGAGADLARQLGNPGLAMPYTILIGPDGTARFRHLGALAEHELEAELQRTIAP